MGAMVRAAGMVGKHVPPCAIQAAVAAPRIGERT
jgi:hypothetical protein